MSENICHKLKVFGIFCVCYNITHLSVTLITQFQHNLSCIGVVGLDEGWMTKGFKRCLRGNPTRGTMQRMEEGMSLALLSEDQQ